MSRFQQGRPQPRIYSALLGVGLLAIGVAIGPSAAQADGVGDAQRKLNQVLDELDALRDQLGQLDEDYAGALDRQEELVVEITASQARVDEMAGQLGDVEVALQSIAVKWYTSGQSLALSPIFSNASSYSQAGQRSALSALAVNAGEGDMDDLQSVVDDLAAERDNLARKQEEQTRLVASLEQQKVQLTALEAA